MLQETVEVELGGAQEYLRELGATGASLPPEGGVRLIGGYESAFHRSGRVLVLWGFDSFRTLAEAQREPASQPRLAEVGAPRPFAGALPQRRRAAPRDLVAAAMSAAGGPRLWRVTSDSSAREQPLVMIRRLLPPERLQATIAFYEELLGEPCDLRFDYPEMQLSLASVGAVLLIAGSEEALAPFVATAATLLVASLEETAELVRQGGGEVLEPPKAVPTGRNMLARHPDGALVEYVEHRPQPGETAPPARGGLWA